MKVSLPLQFSIGLIASLLIVASTCPSAAQGSDFYECVGTYRFKDTRKFKYTGEFVVGVSHDGQSMRSSHSNNCSVKNDMPDFFHFVCNLDANKTEDYQINKDYGYFILVESISGKLNRTFHGKCTRVLVE